MFIGGPCHGAIEHIEGYFILRFQGLEDRWQFSTENLATLWQKGNTKPIRPEPEPIIMLTLKYSRNMVHVCVCVPFNDFCVVFFWRFAMRKRPWFNIRTFFRCAPEIPSHGRFGGVAVTRDHQRSPESPESPVTSRYWSATANSWMPWDMPSARWRTWRKLLKGLGAMKADQAAWLWMFEVLNIFLRTQMIASNTRMLRIALGIQVR